MLAMKPWANVALVLLPLLPAAWWLQSSAGYPALGLKQHARDVLRTYGFVSDLVVAHLDAAMGREEEPDGPAVRMFTLEELKEYDGKPGRADPTLLIAVLGRVFNVTSGAEFYAYRSYYHVFAGHDATRNIATFTKDKRLLNNDIADLTPEKLGTVNHSYWDTYVRKYPIVGLLADPLYDVEVYSDYTRGPTYIPLVGQTFDNVTSDAGEKKERKSSGCPMKKAAKVMAEFASSFGTLLLGAPAAPN